MRTVKPGMCVVAALALAALAAGALASQGAPAADAGVQIDQFAFLPQRITVKPGTTVTWTNDDDDSHTVASSAKLFKSGPLDTGDKFSFTFTTPGTYAYFCSVHPQMTGTIVVEPASGASAGP
ncbi:MAG TPA: cupredoxin family copper-binding protein [Xanthobacteraceae bacterium]|jgi:plastocyanin|nr:cupredoxin family copper-binding protein [Xanthobacteraceae bacterium]